MGLPYEMDQRCVPPCGASVTQLPSKLTPTITSLSPNTGPPAGGTSVVITGTNLADATSVMFGATAAAFTVDSATQITAVSPPLA